MSIGGIISGGLASILSGGTLGVFGAIGSGILDYFKTKAQYKHQLDVISAQKELALVNANSQAVLETLKLVSASYEHDKATYSKDIGFVDWYRGTLRPTVTYLLLAISIFLAIWAFKMVGLETDVVKEIAKYAVYTCLDLTALCVSWYFGARQIDKIRRK